MAKDLAVINQQARDLRAYLNQDNVRGPLAEAMPKWLNPERMLKVIFSATLRNPALLECTKESILQSVMMCAQLGLEPILGRAYLIPYNNRKNIDGQWVSVKECQMQPGYQGLIDLAKRSGEIADVYAEIVFEKDVHDINFGTERKIVHKPYLAGDPGKPLFTYSVWFMKDGTQHPAVMRMHDVWKRRDQSQGYQFAKSKGGKVLAENPWEKWTDEMVRKTVIKWSSKQVPASIDFMEAVALDDAAEMGRVYVSPFAEQLTQPPAPTAFDMAGEFDSLAGTKYDGATLQKFNAWIEDTANKNGMTVEVAKAEIIRTDDFDNASKAFERTVSIGRKHSPEEIAGLQAKDTRETEKAPVQETNGNQGKAAAGPVEEKAGKSEVKGKQEDNGGEKESGDADPGGGSDDVLTKDHPFFRANWIRMKQGSRKLQTGLWSHVDLHHARIPEMPMELFTKLARKFQAMYGKPFPYDPDGVLIEKNAKFGSGKGEAPESETGRASSPEEVVEQAGSSGPADVTDGSDKDPEENPPETGAHEVQENHENQNPDMEKGWDRLSKVKAKYPAAWAQCFNPEEAPTTPGEIDQLIRKVEDVAEFTEEKF
jgi:phage RecT family recombinase